MVLILAAMIVGLLCDRMLDLDPKVYIAAAITSLASWYLVFTYNGKSNRHRHYFRASIASLLLSIGIASVTGLWHHGRWNWVGPNDISFCAEAESKPICLQATVSSEPRWQAIEDSSDGLNAVPVVDRTRVTIRVNQVRNGVVWQEATGEIDLVIHERCDHIRSGDQIQAVGSIVRISEPSNPGQFDFRNFYRSQGKCATVHSIHAKGVTVVARSLSWQGQVLSTLRRKLNEMTWQYVPKERAALASAVLLGNRSQLTLERRERFLMTGTVHLLAISGLHVGILSGVFFFFFRVGLIRRTTFLWATILFVLFYCWLVEFRAPVCRATILIVLLCLGRLCGQPILSFNWLATAACVVLLINPMDLFQLGPQLSFLAVGTITFGRHWLVWPPPIDPVKRLIANTRPFHVRVVFWLGRKVRFAILVSGLIWLVAMPMVAYRFNLVAPVALVVNPIVLLPIAMALYGGLGVLVFGWLPGGLANMFGQFCDWNLGLIEWLISIANGIPYGHIWTMGPSGVSVIGFYIGVFFLAVFPKTRVSAKWFFLWIFGWIVFGWLVPDAIHERNLKESNRPFAATFIDVGHGTSVLLELPDGRNILYDAGSLGSSTFGARNVASVLWDCRIEHLDAMVLSHADIDHFNAVPEICNKFSVGRVYMSPVMRRDISPSTQTLLRELERSEIVVENISAGDRLVSRGIDIKALSPPEFGMDGNDNSNSVVLWLSYEGKSLLLTGDLESTGMDLLLTRASRDVDVLMAPHHGSINSSPTRLTEWCEPEFVVISASGKRVDAKVEQIFKDSGARVFCTDRDGAVRFEFMGKNVKPLPYLNSSTR